MNGTVKKVLVAAIAAVFLSTLVVGCGRGVVAKVYGKKITRQEYYSRMERLPFRRDQQTGQTTDAGSAILQQLISEELILRMAEEAKVAPTEAQIKLRFNNARKQKDFDANVKKLALTKDQVNAVFELEQAIFNLQTKGVKVSDSEVRGFYEKNLDAQFTTPENARVAAIFAKDKDIAKKAMDLLVEKKVAFGTVARTMSSDKTSAENDGRIPMLIQKGDPSIPVIVQNKILATQVNSFTEPIAGGGGTYVIFKVLAHRPKMAIPFKDVKDGIWHKLMQQKGSAKKIDLNAELMKFREKADIEIFIERYKDLIPKKEQPKKS